MQKKYLTPEEIRSMSLNELLASQKQEKTPIYISDNTRCVHSLHYDWTGWTSGKVSFPPSASDAVNICQPFWENDGFTLKKWKTKDDMIQILFEVNPEVAPVLLTQRVKGRLDNAFRKLKTPVKFSRKVGFRCLGDNTSETVNNYVLKQVGKSDYADKKYREFLEKFTVHGNAVLSEPVIMSHGRYWYNIHLVIVADDRSHPVTGSDNFEKIRNGCFKIAAKKECRIAGLSVMPDHVHISLKGNPVISPLEIGLSFLNNLSYILGYNHCWSNEFYTGTFSEYSLEKLF